MKTNYINLKEELKYFNVLLITDPNHGNSRYSFKKEFEENSKTLEIYKKLLLEFLYETISLESLLNIEDVKHILVLKNINEIIYINIYKDFDYKEFIRLNIIQSSKDSYDKNDPGTLKLNEMSKILSDRIKEYVETLLNDEEIYEHYELFGLLDEIHNKNISSDELRKMTNIIKNN